MEEKIKKVNHEKEFISLNKADSLTLYSQEYLSLLCRQGKLKGKKIGRNWVTTKEWLNEYQAKIQSNEKEKTEAVKINVKVKKSKIKYFCERLGIFFRKRSFQAPPAYAMPGVFLIAAVLLITALPLLLISGNFSSAKAPRLSDTAEHILKHSLDYSRNAMSANAKKIAQEIILANNSLEIIEKQAGAFADQKISKFARSIILLDESLDAVRTIAKNNISNRIIIADNSINKTAEKFSKSKDVISASIFNQKNIAAPSIISLGDSLNIIENEFVNFAREKIAEVQNLKNSEGFQMRQKISSLNNSLDIISADLKKSKIENSKSPFEKSPFEKNNKLSDKTKRNLNASIISLSDSLNTISTVAKNNISNRIIVADNFAPKKRTVVKILNSPLQNGDMDVIASSIISLSNSLDIIENGSVNSASQKIITVDNSINKKTEKLSKSKDIILSSIFSQKKIGRVAGVSTHQEVKPFSKRFNLLSPFKNIWESATDYLAKFFMPKERVIVRRIETEVPQIQNETAESAGGSNSTALCSTLQDAVLQIQNDIAILRRAIQDKEIITITKTLKGEKGDAGLTGLTGLPGEQGLTGPAGEQGLVGDRGPKGPEGTGNVTVVQSSPHNTNTWSGSNVFSGHGIFESLGVSYDISAGRSLGVGGSTTLGSDANDTLTVHATSNFIGPIASGAWQGTAIATQYGGTGQDWSSSVHGSVPYFSADGAMSTLDPGTSGYYLKTQGSDADPVWTAISTGVGPHDLLSITHSDTTAGAVARGDLIAGQGATPSWEKLTIGSSGHILRSDGTDIAWSPTTNITELGIITTGTWNASIIDSLYGGTGADLSAAVQGGVPYFSAAGVMSALGPGTLGQALISGGSGAPSWGQAGVNDATYLTLSLNPSLSAERILTTGTNISFDTGTADKLIVATIDNPVFSTSVDSPLFISSSGNISFDDENLITTGAANFGTTTLNSLSVTTTSTLTGNVDATAGLDVTGGNLTLDNSNFVVNTDKFQITGTDGSILAASDAFNIDASGNISDVGSITSDSAIATTSTADNSITTAGEISSTRTGAVGLDIDGSTELGSVAGTDIHTIIGGVNITENDGTVDALKVTQTGAGNVFLVEDEASDDSTPFVIDADGNVGIGTASPLATLDVRGTIENGLVAWWSMDEGTGETTITDQSINSNTGTLGGGTAGYRPTWTNGKFGKGLSFDGTDDYVDCGSVGDIKTISFWVKPCTTTEDIMETWGVSGDNVTFTYRGSSVTYGTVSHNSECWLDRNLGASQVATAYNDSAAYGDLFQWGRLDDNHQDRASGTTSTNSSTDNPGHANFILEPNSPYDWRDPQNDNLWQGVSGINNPCPTGWRIPTETELNTERLSWSSNNYNGAYASPLKLTAVGYRNYGSGSLSYAGVWGYYWSFTISGTSVRSLCFDIATADIYSTNRAYAISVRCLKDNSESGILISGGTISANDFVSPTIYVDGAISSTIDTNWHLVTITSDTGINVSKLNIGKIGTDYFNGQIDEVRIYNRALSAREISESYRQKAPSMAQGGTISDNSAFTALTIQQSSTGNIVDLQGTGLTSGKAISLTNSETAYTGTAIELDIAQDQVDNAFLYDGAAYTDNTTEANSNAGTAYDLLSLEAVSNDELYFSDSATFDTLNFDIVAAGAGVTLAVKYCSAETAGVCDTWTAVSSTSDGTSNFTQDGKITWTDPGSTAWKTCTIDSVSAKWIQMTSTGTNITTAPTAYYSTISMFTGNFAEMKNAGSTKFVIDSDGNMGIGTDTPLSTLDVRGTIENGLVAWWSMDEGTGETTITDQSINSNTGTLGGGTAGYRPTWTNGKFGKALDFDGTDDYVEVADHASLRPTIITLSFWYKRHTEVSGEYIFKNRFLVSQTKGLLIHTVAATDKLKWRLGNGSSVVDIYSNTAISVSEWVLYTCTYDGTTMRMYIDGILQSDSKELGGDIVYVDSGNFYISDATNTVQGQIDEVKIYNRALSAREISESYRQKAPSMAQGGTISDNSAFTALTVTQSGTGAAAEIGDATQNLTVYSDGRTIINYSNFEDISEGSAQSAFTVRPVGFTAVAYEDAGVYTDRTDEAKSTMGTAFTVAETGAGADIFYVGHTEKFYNLTFDLDTVSDGDVSALDMEFSAGGTTWTAITSEADGTAITGSTLKQDGSIQWEDTDVSTWAKEDIDTASADTTSLSYAATDYYWVRMKWTGNASPPVTAYIASLAMGTRMEIYAQSGDTTPTFYINDKGNVAIGTTSISSASSLTVDQIGTGKIVDFKNAGTSAFEVNQAIVKISQPLQINVAGDVGFSRSIEFTSTGASHIFSEGPFTIAAGDPNSSENLTLTTRATEELAETGDVTTGVASYIIDTGQTSWVNDEFVGGRIEITAGPGIGEIREICANAASDDDRITACSNFSITPTTASDYSVYRKAGDILVNIGGTNMTSGGFKVLGMDTNAIFRISPEGDVGIGTMSPSYALDIKSKSTVGTAFFVDGGGAAPDLDDITTGGTFIGATALDYRVKIDSQLGGAGGVDTFTWSDDGGSTWDAVGVDITGSAQDLNNGVTVIFAATTGHDLDDYWNFSTTVTNPFAIQNAAGTRSLSVGNDGNISVSAGVDNSTLLTIQNTDTAIGTAGYLLELIHNANDDADADFLICQDDGAGTPDTVFSIASDGTLFVGGSASIGSGTANSADMGTGAAADLFITDDLEVDGDIYAAAGITGVGSVDFGGGTLEIPNGTALPATCSVGQIFHDTDSNDCANTGSGDGALCICKAVNTWVLISDF